MESQLIYFHIHTREYQYKQYILKIFANPLTSLSNCIWWDNRNKGNNGNNENNDNNNNRPNEKFNHFLLRYHAVI